MHRHVERVPERRPFNAAEQPVMMSDSECEAANDHGREDRLEPKAFPTYSPRMNAQKKRLT
jgi:hypothetical protein